jgi:hypothetical protein
MDDDEALRKERELEEQEREAQKREAHERSPEADEAEGGDRPAPPGPESQQPRG